MEKLVFIAPETWANILSSFEVIFRHLGPNFLEKTLKIAYAHKAIFLWNIISAMTLVVNIICVHSVKGMEKKLELVFETRRQNVHCQRVAK